MKSSKPTSKFAVVLDNQVHHSLFRFFDQSTLLNLRGTSKRASELSYQNTVDRLLLFIHTAKKSANYSFLIDEKTIFKKCKNAFEKVKKLISKIQKPLDDYINKSPDPKAILILLNLDYEHLFNDRTVKFLQKYDSKFIWRQLRRFLLHPEIELRGVGEEKHFPSCDAVEYALTQCSSDEAKVTALSGMIEERLKLFDFNQYKTLVPVICILLKLDWRKLFSDKALHHRLLTAENNAKERIGSFDIDYQFAFTEVTQLAGISFEEGLIVYKKDFVNYFRKWLGFLNTDAEMNKHYNMLFLHELFPQQISSLMKEILGKILLQELDKGTADRPYLRQFLNAGARIHQDDLDRLLKKPVVEDLLKLLNEYDAIDKSPRKIEEEQKHSRCVIC